MAVTRRPAALEQDQLDTLREAAEMGLLSDSLRGKHVVLTGQMSLRRADIEFVIKLAGGRIDAATCSKTNLVVVGNTGDHGQTSKIQAAAARKIDIISEHELVLMLSVV